MDGIEDIGQGFRKAYVFFYGDIKKGQGQEAENLDPVAGDDEKNQVQAQKAKNEATPVHGCEVTVENPNHDHAVEAVGNLEDLGNDSSQKEGKGVFGGGVFQGDDRHQKKHNDIEPAGNEKMIGNLGDDSGDEEPQLVGPGTAGMEDSDDRQHGKEGEGDAADQTKNHMLREEKVTGMVDEHGDKGDDF